jgi:hypothetical protein
MSAPVKVHNTVLEMIKEYDREALHMGVEEGMFTFEDVRFYASAYDDENYTNTLGRFVLYEDELYAQGREFGFFSDEQPEPYKVEIRADDDGEE